MEPAGELRETFQVPLLECGSSAPLPLAPNAIGVTEKMETIRRSKKPSQEVTNVRSKKPS